MWLQTYGWMDGQTDGQNDGQKDKIMGGQSNEWMDMQCMCIDMQKQSFSTDFEFLTKYYGRTDRPTDRQMDGQTLLQRCDTRI